MRSSTRHPEWRARAVVYVDDIMGLTRSGSTRSQQSPLSLRGLVACLATSLALLTVTVAQEVPPKPRLTGDDVEILLREFPKGWIHFSSQADTPLNATWQIAREQDANKDAKDSVLICLGKPDGYIRTEKEYENFELDLEWKYPADPNGNSGILLYTIEKDMIWPKSVQIQLHRPTAGSIFPSNGGKVDNPLPAKDLSRPVNVWNDCQITSVDGKISVTLNGHKVGEVTGCMPQKGCVGLQSEGSEIHFRNVRIKPLPATVPEKRISSRKQSVRHKKIPVCPPEMIFTEQPDSEISLPAQGETHRTKAESQRISRALRRFELHGKLKPSLFRNLSPFAVMDGPWMPERPPVAAP